MTMYIIPNVEYEEYGHQFCAQDKKRRRTGPEK